MKPNAVPFGGNFPVAEYPMYDKYYGNHLNVAKMLPPAFSLVCCVLFLVPTYMVISIARNPIVAYFNSYWSYTLLVIPVIIAAVHTVHSWKGAPSKIGVTIALVVPSAMLLIFTDIHWQSAGSLAEKLLSTDCDSFKDKATLQHSWEEAYFAFESCVNQTGSRTDIPESVIMKNFRLEDCQEYNAVAASHTEAWSYFKYLEQAQACAGWCYPGQQLWASTPAKDSCSIVVSSAFRYLVQPRARSIYYIMLCVLLMTALLLVCIGPRMRAMGYDW
mmetsp:Transcript_13901/g.37864  ORF Transcript_13901/g.37864 Transcript_13901/m.37864 type:complete len:274 (-) Transcript_13901:114-935(-)|eukprot:CAMPEP_0117473024 /NCGR_PEP_ID=MMETSP0784-20121206/8553_1 /TAXON_ID=39447 /ORGANISM="" /LENGTH=273 /DNA_ID=CAMNT_0005267201 /DNA_START=57 /DNA_END=878 /DNA_ORIENTATION=+